MARCGNLLKMSRLLSNVSNEDHRTTVLKIRYPSWDADSSSLKQMDAALKQSFDTGSFIGPNGYKD